MQFDSPIHLIGRHPELATNELFLKWVAIYGVSNWYERHTSEDGHISLSVRSANGRFLFAAFVLLDPNPDGQTTPTNVVSETVTLDLFARRPLEDEAIAESLKHAGIEKSSVQAVRPIVGIGSKTPSLAWEVELIVGGNIFTYVVHEGGTEQTGERPCVKQTRVASKRPQIMITSGDELEENELHHLNKYRALAVQWTRGANTARDKAFRIWMNTRAKMVYDSGVTNISDFIWSDELIIDQLGWRGICDEWAVIQATMLRAVGIPAVVKFLLWPPNVGHACVEWHDGSTWRHLDALWSAFDLKSVYRDRGARDVTVMDASFPRDNRSTGPVFGGVPDPTGDLKLYYWGDYIISPNYPGQPRPGYSY